MSRKSTEVRSGQGEKEVDVSQEKKRRAHWHEAHCGLFWPIFLIVIGFVWLARNLGWLGPNFPWFPLALIAFGVYLLCAHGSRKKRKIR